MTHRAPPTRPLALLERFVSDSDPLAGDLLEEFRQRQSSAWLWLQALAAIAIHLLTRSHTIRPLRLLETQPPDAVERSQRLYHRDRSINLGASPLSSVGGLGLVSLAALLTRVAPHAWLVLLVGAIAGLSSGIVIIATRSPWGAPIPTIRLGGSPAETVMPIGKAPARSGPR
jgi:predicted lysophospholipase L1 biosynthesis ABC-type transport system permease subunit